MPQAKPGKGFNGVVTPSARHPGARSELTQIAIDCAKKLQSLFNPNSVTYEILELGWNPEEDIPLPQEPEVKPFEGFCEQPCFNFVQNLGCRCTGYRVAEVADGKNELPQKSSQPVPPYLRK